MSRQTYLIAKAAATFSNWRSIPEPDPGPTLDSRSWMDDAYARGDMRAGHAYRSQWVDRSQNYRRQKHYRDEHVKFHQGRAEETLRRLKMHPEQVKGRRDAALKARARETLNRLEMSPGHRVLRAIDRQQAQIKAAKETAEAAAASAPHKPPVPTPVKAGGGKGKLIAAGALGAGALGGGGYLVARNRRRNRE